MVFQSLFWWILYCDLFQIHFVQILLRCFNPCFGGSYIVTSCTTNYFLLLLCFNPCFGGSYIVTLHTGSPCMSSQDVSILVLVDLILWPNKMDLGWWYDWVSILVLVDLILWQLCETRSANFFDLFQSLFWWILYCDMMNSYKQL